ncbi:hypothetical protein [Gellertiella hungarica]|uniref:Uncharacterized protein n=1 Tax=Gellertiella hungarica TaxID=1572859 RepID=A0A7W6J8K8_9HYPH|nr:hypothetical protein [Gellertiella hungarica]MBB4066769.1 hypothetical protein [Gellertiella hungarica]
MARKASVDQLAFDFFGNNATPATPAAPVALPDPVKEALLGAKLEHNEFLLNLNRGLTSKLHVPFPSRLYRFPVEFMDRDRTKTASSQLLLRHPRLWDCEFVAPFLEEIEQRSGIRAVWQDHDEFGRDRGELPRWWHAVDLCNNKHWSHLMDTAHLTGTDEIFRAVRFHIECCSLSTKTARQIMRQLETEEPADRSRGAILGDGMSPGRCQQGISPNIRLRGPEGAWLAIHAVEDGYLKKRGSFMMVPPDTMAAREQAKAA